MVVWVVPLPSFEVSATVPEPEIAVGEGGVTFYNNHTENLKIQFSQKDKCPSSEIVGLHGGWVVLEHQLRQ